MKKLPLKYLAAAALVMAVAFQAAAQGLQLGQKAPAFSLKDSQGKAVSLNDFKSAQTIAVVFTNTLCPYSKLYENRLMSLSRDFSGRGVQFIFVNPSVGTGDNDDTPEKMAAKNYGFPYLVDEGQKLSAQFGATRMPEVFLLHNVNGEFILKYKGAIDDNPQAENFVKDLYLRNAIEALLSGRNLQTVDKRATGCMIRKL